MFANAVDREKSLEDPQQSFEFFGASLLRFILESKQRLQDSWQKRFEITSNQPKWDSLLNLKMWLDPKYHELVKKNDDDPRDIELIPTQELEIRFDHTLRQNFEAYVGEFILGKPLQIFPFDVVPEMGITGMKNSYTANLAQYGGGFVEKLKKQGLNPERAYLEWKNMEALDRWSLEAPVGDQIIWTSPTGSKKSGYIGNSRLAHSFVFVYKKISADFVEMKQYRCWANKKQLARFQSDLEHPPQTEGQITDLDLIANLFSPTPDQEKILEEKLYLSESSWAKKRSDLPQVSDEIEKQQRELVFDFYLKKLRALLEEIPDLPKTDPYWSSHEFRVLVKEMDFLFGITDQGMLRWAENFRGSKKIGPDVDISGLNHIYQIGRKQFTGEEITAEESRSYGVSAKHLLALGNTFISVGQCGAGTPVSLMIQASRLSLTTPGSLLLSPNTLRLLSPKEMNELKPDQKEVLKHMANTFTAFFELKDNNGVLHRFWTMPEYVEAYKKGSYVSEDDKFYGPCDILLLEGDDNVISDEMHKMLLNAENVDSESKIQKIKDAFADKATAPEERIFVNTFFKYLMDKLFKPSVGVFDVINNDLSTHTFDPIVAPLARILAQSTNPIHELRLFVSQFAKQYNDESWPMLPNHFEFPVASMQT